MKACLMKVNYDPKYTTPHTHKPFGSLQVRLDVAKNVYKSSSNHISKVKESLEEAARKKLKKQDGSISCSPESDVLKYPSIAKVDKQKKQVSYF